MSLGKPCTKPAQSPLLPKTTLWFWVLLPTGFSLAPLEEPQALTSLCSHHGKTKSRTCTSYMTFSCSSCCSHFPTQTRHVYPETATAALKARPRVASKCLKTFSFFHFSLAGHKLVSPDLCLNLGASKGFTTSLLCAQRSSVRQPWSQINLHYGNRENYKGNDNCLERYVTMRLDLSTWPLVRFLLQVHLSVFCLLWQHY